MMYKKLLLFALSLLLLYSCGSPGNGVYCRINGFAQGTTYNITYNVPDTIDYQPEVDSILKDFDMSLSSYQEHSVISRINRNDPGIKTDEHFNAVFKKSEEVWKESDGMFDITVMPLVNAWGFGPGKKQEVSGEMIDSLLQFVGMGKVRLEDNRIIKSDPRIQLDVNAIAQGYSVDLVAEFMESRGVKDYMVEIGGEVRVKGRNPDNQDWRVGIDRPEFGNMIPGDQLQAIISLSNRSLATSGNYRRYYEENGVKYTHTIDPKTGYPARNSVLSATIIADDCMTADAYATVCMVCGLDKSKEILKKHPELEAYLIFGDESGFYSVFTTEGMKKMISE